MSDSRRVVQSKEQNMPDQAREVLRQAEAAANRNCLAHYIAVLTLKIARRREMGLLR